MAMRLFVRSKGSEQKGTGAGGTMKGVKTAIAGVTLLGAILAYESAAQATPLKFTATGAIDFYFTMDSDPSPFQFGMNDYIEIADVPASGELTSFLSSASGGGMYNAAIGDLIGNQLYTGTEDHPHFAPGTFSLERFTLGDTQLVISATPIPAALPLFASALTGLGFIGWRRRLS